uniref:Lipoxygenase domain-containing protein n=1 Tax=Cucumis sativus TaxID=3659 RepID=A0A0A0KZ89_CUCSA
MSYKGTVTVTVNPKKNEAFLTIEVIYLEFVSVELDSKGNQQIIGCTAGLKCGGDVSKLFETSIDVPGDFGEIGAVIVELDDDVKERFIDTITIDFKKCTLLTFSCKSWVQPKNKHAEERIEAPFYVPRDENFSEEKQGSVLAENEALLGKAPFSDLPELDIKTPFAASKINQLPFDIPSLVSSNQPPPLNSLDDEPSSSVELPLPESYKRDKYNWLSDIEFARLTLAGLNPYSIQLVKSLPFMSKLDEGDYGPRESKFTHELVQELLGCRIKVCKDILNNGKKFSHQVLIQPICGYGGLRKPMSFLTILAFINLLFTGMYIHIYIHTYMHAYIYYQI